MAAATMVGICGILGVAWLLRRLKLQRKIGRDGIATRTAYSKELDGSEDLSVVQELPGNHFRLAELDAIQPIAELSATETESHSA